ncbi:a6e8d19e-ff85-4f84-9a87-f73c55bd3d41 [Sclerotinia trifoliorum]|uniref:A6e8d19e-ff85-4f84-9a87-f73c55bd3d41 n=1 Tax=Sclerotinia trifoliorum TaxID=28548 RepID=A0A8H2W1V9_9HELO|nr:a6e8d19e-ff85-4f84-9a87-f73c55bd3d41 [Sclerotinia trifoliorum]
MAASSSADVFAYIVAIFVPPLAVFLKVACGVDFLINICLTILGWIPGVIHAWYVISKHDPARYAP